MHDRRENVSHYLDEIMGGQISFQKVTVDNQMAWEHEWRRVICFFESSINTRYGVKRKKSYKSQLGCEHATFLNFILFYCNVNWSDSTRLTKGVSFGPQINASQMKKSDSEIGPWERDISMASIKGIGLLRLTSSEHSIWWTCEATVYVKTR